MKLFKRQSKKQIIGEMKKDVQNIQGTKERMDNIFDDMKDNIKSMQDNIKEMQRLNQQIIEACNEGLRILRGEK